MRRLLLLFVLVGCAGPQSAPRGGPAQALVDAVRNGDTTAVAALLGDGISADTMAPDGARPLTEAARHGQVAVARQLLAVDAQVNLPDSAGYRAWDYAIEGGSTGIAALLTWHAAQLAGASSQANAWFAAVAESATVAPRWDRVLDGELESLGLLYAVILDRSALVVAMRHGGGIPNRTGITPLAMAARLGDTQSVMVLLRAGANPDLATGDRWGSTPLMEAARDGHVEIARRLLRAGARVNHPDSSRGTALHWAVRAGKPRYAEVLLQGGADQTLPDLAGETPLAIARRLNQPGLVALLESWQGRRR
jgi:ankyrin repeat protein